MSPTKRNVLAGAIILAAIFSLSALVFRYYTNFGKPYVVEESGTSAKMTIWFFEKFKLFHVTYEVDVANMWEAAEINVLFDKNTAVYCRDEQVKVIIENGKLIFLEGAEISAPGEDIRPKVGKLMMDSVKKIMNLDEAVPKPKAEEKPSRSL